MRATVIEPVVDCKKGGLRLAAAGTLSPICVNNLFKCPSFTKSCTIFDMEGIRSGPLAGHFNHARLAA